MKYLSLFPAKLEVNVLLDSIHHRKEREREKERKKKMLWSEHTFPPIVSSFMPGVEKWFCITCFTPTSSSLRIKWTLLWVTLHAFCRVKKDSKFLASFIPSSNKQLAKEKWVSEWVSEWWNSVMKSETKNPHKWFAFQLKHVTWIIAKFEQNNKKEVIPLVEPVCYIFLMK